MRSPCYGFWRAVFASILLVVITGPLSANAASTDSPPQTQNVLRLNVSPDGYPPYLITSGKETRGIMWDVVNTISQRLGYRLEPAKIPRKRVDQMLRRGRIDATTRAIEWTHRPEDFVFTDPIVEIEEVLFFTESSAVNFKTPEDLRSMKLVTHLGYHYPALDSYFESGAIERFDVARDQDMFHYVLRGDGFDAAIADRLVGQWLLLEHGMKEHFQASETSLSNYKFRIMFRPDWSDFVDKFNDELALMRQSGELDAILSEYR